MKRQISYTDVSLRGAHSLSSAQASRRSKQISVTSYKWDVVIYEACFAKNAFNDTFTGLSG